MKATIVVNGRFHLFHLARQLEKRGLLERVYTGYPRFKLQDEIGVPPEKITTFPYLHAPYMVGLRFGLASAAPRLKQKWLHLSHLALDSRVSHQIRKPTVVIGLSSGAFQTGRRAKALGGAYVCDRGSSHISFQDRILREEYRRWGLEFSGILPRVVAREVQEYAQADAITVPSDFCVDSFVQEGVPKDKLHLIPYGARLDRFRRVEEPPTDEFRVIWVGAISVRKAFLDALHAFQKLEASRKKFIVVGMMEPAVKKLLATENLAGVQFVGHLPNRDLPQCLSSSHAFVLPSIEEGLAIVMGEALACGCPVIAAENTGARNLFTDGVEGFIVPIRSPDAICERLSLLASDMKLRGRMSDAALQKVSKLGGWDAYGERFAHLVELLGRPQSRYNHRPQ